MNPPATHADFMAGTAIIVGAVLLVVWGGVVVLRWARWYWARRTSRYRKWRWRRR